jgi:hypothetical protein
MPKEEKENKNEKGGIVEKSMVLFNVGIARTC